MEQIQLPQEPLTRQEWLQEMEVAAIRPHPFPTDALLLALCLLLLALALLPALLHFFRRFPEPWPLARSLLLGALGVAVGLSLAQEGGEVGVVGAALLVGLYALLLPLELRRRHWEDVKVLLMVPALALVVLLPYLSLPLLLVWACAAWRRFFLFRSHRRVREEELRPVLGVRGRLQGEEGGHG